MDRAPESLNPEELLEHASWVRALAVALVGENKADDLAQQTMLRAMERPPRHRGNLRAWLGTIARNFAVSSARTDSRRGRLLDKRVYEDQRDLAHSSESQVLPETPEQLLSKNEAASNLMQVLMDLPDPGRHLLMLRYFEGLTPAEIAARHGMKPVTVRVQISRALEELRRLMRLRFGGDGLGPCHALLAPLPLPGVVSAAAAATWLLPSATAAGILTVAAAGVYLWASSGTPSEDPFAEIAATVEPDESERDSGSKLAATEIGVSDTTRRAADVSPTFVLRVLDPSGSAVRHALVRSYRDGETIGAGATDPAGEVRRSEALGAAVLQVMAPNRPPELRRADWGLSEYEWQLREGEYVQGSVSQASGAELGEFYLALVGDQALYREDEAEFELLGEIDQRYASYRRFLVSVNADGSFRFDGLPEGWTGSIASSDPRFVLDDRGLDEIQDGQLRITAPASDLNLSLIAVPRLTGQVLPPKGMDAHALRDAVLTVRSPDGALRVPLDETGCFEVLADARAWPEFEVQIRAPFAGSASYRFADMPAHAELGELQLQVLRRYALRVLDAQGRALPSARVTELIASEWWEGAAMRESVVDAEGRADFAVSPDATALRIGAPGYESVRIDADNLQTEGVNEFKLAPASSLALRLLGPDGPLPDGASSNLQILLEAEQGFLSGDPTLDRDFQPRLGSLLASGISAQGLTSGRFQAAPGGILQLLGVRTDGILDVRVVTQTGVPLIETQLDLSMGGEAQVHELTLPVVPRAYHGTVIGPDGRSVPGAWVALGPVSGNGEEGGWLRARTDLQGNFEFPALWRDQVDLRIQAEGMALYGATNVVVTAGEDRHVHQLQRGRLLTLQLSSAEGGELHAQELRAFAAGGAFYRVFPELGEALTLHSVPYEELVVEFLVDGCAYRAVVDAGAVTWPVQLPESISVGEHTWQIAQGSTPFAFLRPAPGSESIGGLELLEQQVRLRPVAGQDGAYSLPSTTRLPRGEWQLHWPDGRAESFSVR